MLVVRADPVPDPLNNTRHPELGPLGMWLVEDSPGFRRAVTWPVRPATRPRIVEITDADCSVDLVQRHPTDVSDGRGPDWQHLTGRRGRWLIPDRQSVAEAFDAVHLTVQCYLTTTGQAIDLGQDPASMIAGWARTKPTGSRTHSRSPDRRPTGGAVTTAPKTRGASSRKATNRRGQG